MEERYLAKYQNIGITEKIDFENYFNEYGAVLSNISGSEHGTEFAIPNLVGVSERTLEDLKKTCSITNLLPQKRLQSPKTPPEGFKPRFSCCEIPQDDLDLKSLTAMKDRNRKALKKKVSYLGEIDLEDALKGDKDKRRDLQPQNFYVLRIRVYLPGRHVSYAKAKKSTVPKVNQEFLCLSCGTLEDLRDRILCNMDYQPLSGDDVNKTAMFFFGSDFYIDDRDPKSEDYVKSVREWGGSRFSFGKMRNMAGTTWYDCNYLRLGYPYLYIHQGFCEHLVVITDIRLINERDTMDSTKYPLLLSIANLRGKPCLVCPRTAKYVVVNNERLPQKFAYFCTICLHLFNYTGGRKIGNFQVFKYVDRVSVL